MPAPVGVEEAEDVEGDDGIGAGALGVKVGLAQRWISERRGTVR